MHQDKPRQEVKTLSIRIPLQLYVTISQYALDKDLSSLNAAIIELVKGGLTETSGRDQVIRDFIVELLPVDELEKLIRGE